MNSAEPRSKTRVALIASGALVVLVILGGAGYAIFNAVRPEPTKTQQASNTTTAQKADFAVLTPRLTDVQEKLKDAHQSHQKAQDALNDASKRIKIGN